jgi:transposase
MDEEIKCRLTWIRMYEQINNVVLVCRRCDVSLPSLRLWLRRYAEQGEAELGTQSGRRNHPELACYQHRQGKLLNGVKAAMA